MTDKSELQKSADRIRASRAALTAAEAALSRAGLRVNKLADELHEAERANFIAKQEVDNLRTILHKDLQDSIAIAAEAQEILDGR